MAILRTQSRGVEVGTVKRGHAASLIRVIRLPEVSLFDNTVDIRIVGPPEAARLHSNLQFDGMPSEWEAAVCAVEAVMLAQFRRGCDVTGAWYKDALAEALLELGATYLP